MGLHRVVGHAGVDSVLRVVEGSVVLEAGRVRERGMMLGGRVRGLGVGLGVGVGARATVRGVVRGARAAAGAGARIVVVVAVVGGIGRGRLVRRLQQGLSEREREGADRVSIVPRRLGARRLRVVRAGVVMVDGVEEGGVAMIGAARVTVVTALVVRVVAVARRRGDVVVAVVVGGAGVVAPDPRGEDHMEAAEVVGGKQFW